MNTARLSVSAFYRQTQRSTSILQRQIPLQRSATTLCAQSWTANHSIRADVPPKGLTAQISLEECNRVNLQQCRTMSDGSGQPPKAPQKRKRKLFLPKKAAVQLTDSSRLFFRNLLKVKPDVAGIMLKYQQATSGEPRMVFSFSFVDKDDLHPQDEGVSLEVMEDGSPKSPADSLDDGLRKLYIHHDGFLKVLGATVDVNTQTMSPILKDREGNNIDPNN